MKITKRIREEAAVICSVVASNAASNHRCDWCWGSVQAGDALGTPEGARRLAHLAWAEAVLTAPLADSAVRYAEAEALLRCGWTP